MDIETLKQALKIAEESIASKNADLVARTNELTARSAELTAKSAELASTLERVKALETELATVNKSLTDSQTKVGELEAEAKVKDSKLADTETKAQLAEVNALVGKKFGPGELDAMIELRATNPKLFAKTMEGRPDMVHGEDITGKDKHATRSMAKGNGSIAKRAREEANKAQADAK